MRSPNFPRPSTPTGTAIREARLAAGMSLYQLADRVGIHASNLCHYEHGDIPVSARQVTRIIEACKP
jgi:transcriptional regulator with XRE-family HTH domain